MIKRNWFAFLFTLSLLAAAPMTGCVVITPGDGQQAGDDSGGDDPAGQDSDDDGDDDSSDNGADDGSDDSRFARFVDSVSGFETTDVVDVDDEVIRFDTETLAIVYAETGRSYQEGNWTVSGNFVGGASFQIRFGVENGVRKAYFTEAGPATICDFRVTESAFLIFPTNEPVPQQ